MINKEQAFNSINKFILLIDQLTVLFWGRNSAVDSAVAQRIERQVRFINFLDKAKSRILNVAKTVLTLPRLSLSWYTDYNTLPTRDVWRLAACL